MADLSTKCAIWSGFTAIESSVLGDSFVRRLTSERAGGAYAITRPAELNLHDFDDRVRARLTTWLVDQRMQGNDRPLITEEVIKYAISKQPLSVDERAERLLRYLGEQPAVLGERLAVKRTPIMARTESTDITEVFYLEDYLKACGWINGRTLSGPNTLTARITVDGHRRIAEKAVNIDSSQAFVAMWFDESMDKAYEEGIRPGIEDAGYRPLRIDRKPDVDKTDDEIIAEIRRSRFLVADFTHGDEGARGSVYFEAGFAHGLSVPVIYTCHSDAVDKLHFDTRQYAHIVWDTPVELRNGLRQRILARIVGGIGTLTSS